VAPTSFLGPQVFGLRENLTQAVIPSAARTAETPRRRGLKTETLFSASQRLCGEDFHFFTTSERAGNSVKGEGRASGWTKGQLSR